MKLLLAILIAVSANYPAQAEEIPSYRRVNGRNASTMRTCTRREYREEFIPGTPDTPGYVKNWYEYVEVPCNGQQAETDTNDCKEGTLIGGLLGGGLAASGSRGKGRLWAVPAGVVGGAMIGCQIDGG